MRNILIAATAAAALAGGALAVSAQDQEKRPQAQGQQPMQSPDKGASQDQQQPGAAQEDKKGKGAQKQAEPKAPKGKNGAQAQKGNEPADKKAEPGLSTAQDKGEAAKKDGAKKSTAQGKADDKAAQDKAAQGKADKAAKDKAAQGKADEKKGPAAASKEGQDQGKQAQDKQAQDKGQRVEISQEQRTRIQTTIRQQNVQRVTNVCFTINVGTRIPRNVRLHALPREIVEVVPRFRGFRFILVEERVVIVDPATYEIVYVIDDSSGPRTRTARLELSASERQLLLTHIQLDRPSTDVRIRLALGAEIPNRVELLAFPDPVVTSIPKLRDFRFVVVERSVAIVDPSNRDVVLVVER